jgi:hypothetical protein
MQTINWGDGNMEKTKDANQQDSFTIVFPDKKTNDLFEFISNLSVLAKMQDYEVGEYVNRYTKYNEYFIRVDCGNGHYFIKIILNKFNDFDGKEICTIKCLEVETTFLDDYDFDEKKLKRKSIYMIKKEHRIFSYTTKGMKEIVGVISKNM